MVVRLEPDEGLLVVFDLFVFILSEKLGTAVVCISR
jgi:hypothetical protein